MTPIETRLENQQIFLRSIESNLREDYEEDLPEETIEAISEVFEKAIQKDQAFEQQKVFDFYLNCFSAQVSKACRWLLENRCDKYGDTPLLGEQKDQDIPAESIELCSPDLLVRTRLYDDHRKVFRNMTDYSKPRTIINTQVGYLKGNRFFLKRGASKEIQTKWYVEKTPDDRFVWRSEIQLDATNIRKVVKFIMTPNKGIFASVHINTGTHGDDQGGGVDNTKDIAQIDMSINKQTMQNVAHVMHELGIDVGVAQQKFSIQEVNTYSKSIYPFAADHIIDTLCNGAKYMAKGKGLEEPLMFLYEKQSDIPSSEETIKPNLNEEKRGGMQTADEKEDYINHLFSLLEEPAIKSNSSIIPLLEKELEDVMSQGEDTLNETSIEKYKWIKKLLIRDKVSDFAVRKLQQLSLSSPVEQILQPPISSPVQNTPSSFALPTSPVEQMTPQPSISSQPVQNTPSSFALPAIAFGKAKWERYFGDVGVEPPLPMDIDEILNAQCPFWPDKQVKETHLLVLVPQTVNGIPFHLNSLSELIRQPKTGHKTKYDYYYPDAVKNELGNQSSPSHWALMTKDVIPGSRNETYDNQKELVASHAQKSGIPYALPLVLDAATAVLMYYVETGERLYSHDPYTYTRCQEKVEQNQWPAAIGGFSSGGLGVSFYFGDSYGRGFYGVGAFRCVK